MYSLNRNPFEVLNVPRTADTGQGEESCVCSECGGYCTCQALALIVVEDYLSITCHPSEGRLLGLCSVMRFGLLGSQLILDLNQASSSEVLIHLASNMYCYFGR